VAAAVLFPQLLTAEAAQAQAAPRGGPDTPDKLARHARRTARAWPIDGQPLLGISVLAVRGIRSASCSAPASPPTA